MSANEKSLPKVFAAIYGFGMMTKVSMGVIVIITAGVFLRKVFEIAMIKRNSSSIRKLIVQYTTFALISFPLGYGVLSCMVYLVS